MTFEAKKAQLAALNPEAYLFDGFEEAMTGIGSRGVGGKPVAVYDREKCIEILMGAGATLAEAEEYFLHNVECVRVGEDTPIIL